MDSFSYIFVLLLNYSEKLTKVPNTNVRKIVLKYTHYYNCVRIQEKLNYLSQKEYKKQVV
ncbi:hypothetical protein B7P27_27830 [Bacillus cereus]|nr:hypothetical protein B7P27_27830 [Bacillus cereus]